MLDDQFWITPTHPRGTGRSSISLENAVLLLNSPMLGVFTHSLSVVTLGLWAVAPECSILFAMLFLQAVCAQLYLQNGQLKLGISLANFLLNKLSGG